MQVLNIVNKLLKYTLTGNMENRKAKMHHTVIGLKSGVYRDFDIQ